MLTKNDISQWLMIRGNPGILQAAIPFSTSTIHRMKQGEITEINFKSIYWYFLASGEGPEHMERKVKIILS